MIHPAHLPLLGVMVLALVSGQAAPSGEKIYRDLCVRCHGPQGEGVAGKCDEPLYGIRTIAQLTALIDETMPENNPAKCVGDDAAAVAAYIYDAFYSPAARARNHPARIELARLTNRQYRESAADLIGSFTPQKPATKRGGLRAEYYQSDGMNKKATKVVTREDERVDFDLGPGSPDPGIKPDQFAVAWQGSLYAPDTGVYELRLRTPNGARLYLNMDFRAGDANLRDDSDDVRQSALIDLWVSSGELREGHMRVFLLGGRTYPLRLDFFKYKEKSASLRLEWKPPHGTWSVLGGDYLSPENSPVVTVVTTPFPADDGSLGYERGSAVSEDWQQATTQAAIELANGVLARLPSLSGVRDDATTNRVEGLKQFAATFAERAFRRPLAPNVRELYVDRHFTPGQDPPTSVRRVVLAVMTSPRFLYPDLGHEADQHAVAARLALGLWDSLPDQALREAARRGELSDASAVRRQADRMLADPRSKAKMREFLHHWLAMDRAEDLSKDTNAFPGFDAAVVADLRVSLDRFVERTVWSETSSYRELLLADYLMLNSRLAAFYDAPGPKGEAFEPVKLPDSQRAGLFTHPYLLASLSYFRNTSPIHRGVFLTRNVLGRFLKPPPMAISFMDDRFDPSLTMREKVTELTKSETCMACHVTINPLGFSLEHYDAVGRWRTEDNRKPVNATADYVTPDGQSIRLNTVRDLARHAAESTEARQGFARQMVHHVAKQDAAAYGAQTLTHLDEGFRNSNCHVAKLYAEVAVLAAQHHGETKEVLQ